jgi:pyruvate formate lyase activating enzyme
MANSVAHIKGMIPVSMLDWDGKLVSTIFLGGCNLRCCFCQNADLIKNPSELSDISWEKVKRHLVDKKNWLDGCVISGGEPCINPGLESLLFQIKDIGYPIKLDTNGTLPQVLSQLIQERLVDYIAMDLKTGLSKYSLIAQTLFDIECIKNSVQLIIGAVKSKLIGAEFRTTVVPEYVHKEDLFEIAKYLGEMGASNYFLQQFDPKHVLEPQIGCIQPYPEEYLVYLADECNKFVPTAYRGLTK